MNPEFHDLPCGIRLAYRRFGPSDGRAVLICHGLGSSSLQWVDDAQWLAARGYHVLVPDLRSHGASSGPAHPTRAAFTMARLAQDLSELCDSLDIGTVDFLGNSLGGNVGLEMIRADAGRIRSLATCGTVYSLNFGPWIVWLRRLTYALIGERKLGEFVANKGTKVDAARPLIRQIYSRFNARANHLINQNIHRFDYLDTARQFRGPVLLIRGADDSAINKELGPTLEVLGRHPSAEIIDLEGAGHFTNLDQPEAFRTAYLSFLRRTESAA